VPIPTFDASKTKLLFAKILEYPLPPASLRYNVGVSAIILLTTNPVSPVV
jgi:hypothetical protein